MYRDASYLQPRQNRYAREQFTLIGKLIKVSFLVGMILLVTTYGVYTMAKNIAIMTAADLGMVDATLEALTAEYGPYDASAEKHTTSTTSAAKYNFPEKYTSLATTSEKVRAMLKDGYSVSTIAKNTGMRYQHVNNIRVQQLKRS